MEILNKDISKLNYKELKEMVSVIDIKQLLHSEELERVITKLAKDSRKNVNALGVKLQKDIKKLQDEINRVRGMYDFDKSFGDYKVVAGVDEVGRGPLAGPIVSCAVVLDLNVIDDELILYINDSKKLNEKKREELAEIIKEKALAYFISSRSAKEIDEKGIGVCNNEVFLEACMNLKIKPDLVLSDGYTVKGIQIDNKSVIKGDTKSACIAAASIVAKVYRDNLMKEYSLKYSGFAFEENAGYGTSKHIEGLKKFGPTEIHRLSFLTNILSD
ncbi:ribonuclease HII [Clostridium celatum]|uniref:Ribonuclease HII n=1 Tax=Clostridium celatum DSM 1785 TaxID=545697 RepID=L1QF67_9CLOT|nr:ribonuclease HII [Clostridium celatum]EKY26596.1 ribonuclease HII [Clostridium celatum DSM 1785]MCE9653859.1 ribonuclease HII [Clostridium celatum]MDU3722411.1 ribonuclease HII [Clostridium celatum]MDY3361848.1 ribonuclease HII [Clostridium celatum]